MSICQLQGATTFVGAKRYYNKGVESILRGCVYAYESLKKDGVVCVNDENAIRDVLVRRYLKNRAFKRRFKLGRFLFDPESVEANGRPDIRVFSPRGMFLDDEQYYLIECKRLDNQRMRSVSGLNAKYIANGVFRFVSGCYPCKFKMNFMIGFLVAPMNIDANVQCINSLFGKHLKDDKNRDVVVYARQKLHQIKGAVRDFEHIYTSLHKQNAGDEFMLYHLMLDFSNNITQKT